MASFPFSLPRPASQLPHVSTTVCPATDVIAIAAIGQVISTALVADARPFRRAQKEGTHHADPVDS